MNLPDTITWLTENWKALTDSVTLAVVVVACVVQYTSKLDKHSHLIEVFGFILTGAGAFGGAVYIWTPKVEPFNFELLMHIGMALIAISVVAGRVRGWLAAQPGFHWAERRERT